MRSGGRAVDIRRGTQNAGREGVVRGRGRERRRRRARARMRGGSNVAASGEVCRRKAA